MIWNLGGQYCENIKVVRATSCSKRVLRAEEPMAQAAAKAEPKKEAAPKPPPVRPKRGAKFSWSKPSNEHFCLGNLLCSLQFYSRFSSILISHQKYADGPSVHNHKIRGNEGEKTRCRTVDVPPFASRSS